MSSHTHTDSPHSSAHPTVSTSTPLARVRSSRLALGIAALSCVGLLLPATATAAQTSPAPATSPVLTADSTTTPGAQAASSTTIDRSNRASVINGYKNLYQPARATTFSENGDPNTCRAGTLPEYYLQASQTAINWARAQAGAPAITLDTEANSFAQEAALLMAANQQLNHNPPSSWKCYNQKRAQGAAASNLAFTYRGDQMSWLELYLDDFGPNNTYVGHRNWFLDPALTEMGVGQTNGLQATYVGELAERDYSPGRANPAGTAWPTSGYFPAPMLPTLSQRWSYNTYYVDNRSLSKATVTMRRLAPTTETVPVSFDHKSDSLLVWRPSGPVLTPADFGGRDVTYEVVIGGVTLDGKPVPNITYQTTLVDPNTTTNYAPITWNTAPTISGDPQPGQQLRVNVGDYTPRSNADVVSVTWKRDGTVVGTSSAYTTTQSDAGKQLIAEVTVTSSTHQGSRSVSVNVGGTPTTNGPNATSAPQITGSPQLGQRLTATNGTWSEAVVGFTYQWSREGAPISGATQVSYTPTSADLGARLTVTVTARNTRGATGSATSEPTAPVTSNPAPQAPTPAITGKPRVGKTLSVAAPAWDLVQVTNSYQWYRGTKPIKAATSSSYRLTNKDAGTQVSVVVTGTKPGHPQGTVRATTKTIR